MTIGVLEENPSSIAGVTKILNHLHKYIPETTDGLHIIPCHGDGLSVERMCDAMRHNSGAATAKERLEGIVPVPQEFHKRMIRLTVAYIFGHRLARHIQLVYVYNSSNFSIQDTFKAFFDMKSCRSRGTLTQMKAEFNRRNVGMNINECFNHAWDFIEVCCMYLDMRRPQIHST